MLDLLLCRFPNILFLVSGLFSWHPTLMSLAVGIIDRFPVSIAGIHLVIQLIKISQYLILACK